MANAPFSVFAIHFKHSAILNRQYPFSDPFNSKNFR